MFNRSSPEVYGRTLAAGVKAAVLCLLAVGLAGAQSGPEPNAPTSDTVFKNVQVLKGIPVDEFMDTMGMFSSALGYDCSSCHSPDIRTGREAFAITTPLILKTRGMIAMMNAINRMYFGGQQRLSCFTCHRGTYSPEIVPSLALQYGEVIDDPNAIAIVPDRRTTADQVFGKYLQAIGGTDRAAKLTSFVAKGTYSGFNTGGVEVPVEIFAKAPDQRTQIVHTVDGNSIKTYDGRTGWVAEQWRPLPLMPLTGGNLTGTGVEATIFFPPGIQKLFTQWQVGSATIDDKRIQVLQGSTSGQPPVNLYFDESGLLVRLVRWNRTAVGTVPTQIDYADYREVAGVRFPFRTTVTWTD